MDIKAISKKFQNALKYVINQISMNINRLRIVLNKKDISLTYEIHRVRHPESKWIQLVRTREWNVRVVNT